MNASRKPTPRPPSDLTPEQLKARALAKSRRAAMLLRARRIRRSVVGLAAALFSAAFLAIYVQLASGHDPALSTKHAISTSAGSSSTPSGSSSGSKSSTSSSSPSSGTESSTATESSGGSGSSSSGSSEESSGPSAVTTSQS
jgi:hypothetical protein